MVVPQPNGAPEHAERVRAMKKQIERKERYSRCVNVVGKHLIIGDFVRVSPPTCELGEDGRCSGYYSGKGKK